MVRQRQQELQHLTVPSFFRCPISMDVMKSPVSLCTGVTYDRSSIQAWLDTGHNTCPATMQVLPSTDFVPNLTLRRLIHLWSQSPLPTISKQQVLDSIKQIDNSTARLDLLSQILHFAMYSDENREFLISTNGFITTILGALSNADEIEILESIAMILDIFLPDKRVTEQLHRLIFKSQRDLLSRFASVLRRGSLNSRIKSTRILEAISFDSESRRRIGENQSLLHEFFRLASSETDPTAVDAGLSCLIAVASSGPVQKELVRLGVERTAVKILSMADTAVPVVEKVIKLLEAVVACAEGRAAVGGDVILVAEIVRRLMKVSRAATESSVAVLWSVCYLSRDAAATEAAGKGNGLAKVLLVMQSDCAAGTRQMCADLVKVLRVNSKSCLASYETQTTHIMPY